MEQFRRKQDGLWCEDVSLEALAETYGTPLYVYSHTGIVKRFTAFAEALAPLDHMICFAVKANSTLGVLDTLASCGAGADIVSGGELYRALNAGIKAEKIVYSGVGKSDREISEALEAGICMFNIESFSELAAISKVAVAMGKRAPVALRINPNIDPKTHPYVATGLKSSKFGIPYDAVCEGYRRASALENIDIVGVDCHIGSQLKELAPFAEAAGRLKELVLSLRENGHNVRYIDVGGGLGITYNEEVIPSPMEYGRVFHEVFSDLNVKIILEPGRAVVGNEGVLLSRVLYTKKGDKKRFAIVDAGMNDLLRPSLYGSFHAVEQVSNVVREKEMTDVVGPICESGDFIAKDRDMPALVGGDLIAVMSAGAYGFTMASTYNSRGRAAEVMVKEGQHTLIRARETYEDLILGEQRATFDKG